MTEPAAKRVRHSDSTQPAPTQAVTTRAVTERTDAKLRSAASMSSLHHALGSASVSLGGMNVRIASIPNSMATALYNHVLDLLPGQVYDLTQTYRGETHIQLLLLIALAWDPLSKFVATTTPGGTTYTAGAESLPESILQWGAPPAAQPPAPETTSGSAGGAAATAVQSLESLTKEYVEKRNDLSGTARQTANDVLKLDVTYVLKALYTPADGFKYPRNTGKHPTFRGRDRNISPQCNAKLKHIMKSLGLPATTTTTIKCAVLAILRLDDNNGTYGGCPRPPNPEMIRLALHAITSSTRIADWPRISGAMAKTAQMTQVMLNSYHDRPAMPRLNPENPCTFLRIEYMLERRLPDALKINLPIHGSDASMTAEQGVAWVYDPTTNNPHRVLLSSVGGAGTTEYDRYIDQHCVTTGESCYVCRSRYPEVACTNCRRKICSECLDAAAAVNAANQSATSTLTPELTPRGHVCLQCILRKTYPVTESVDPAARRMVEVGLGVGAGRRRRRNNPSSTRSNTSTGSQVTSHDPGGPGGGSARVLTTTLSSVRGFNPPPSRGIRQVQAALLQSNAALREEIARKDETIQRLTEENSSRNEQLDDIHAFPQHATQVVVTVDSANVAQLQAALSRAERARDHAEKRCGEVERRWREFQDGLEAAASSAPELQGAEATQGATHTPNPTDTLLQPAAAALPVSPPLPLTPPPPHLLQQHASINNVSENNGSSTLEEDTATNGMDGGVDTGVGSSPVPSPPTTRSSSRRARGPSASKLPPVNLNQGTIDWQLLVAGYLDPQQDNVRAAQEEDNFRVIRGWKCTILRVGVARYDPAVKGKYPSYIVQPSQLVGAGMGLFAARPIPAGTQLGAITHHSPVNQNLPGYAMEKTIANKDELKKYDTSDAILGYCNDSRDYRNQMLGAYGNMKKSDASIYAANESIDAGDELYFDYGKAYWRSP